jgi:hypothetical protein
MDTVPLHRSRSHTESPRGLSNREPTGEQERQFRVPGRQHPDEQAQVDVRLGLLV